MVGQDRPTLAGKESLTCREQNDNGIRKSPSWHSLPVGSKTLRRIRHIPDSKFISQASQRAAVGWDSKCVYCKQSLRGRRNHFGDGVRIDTKVMGIDIREPWTVSEQQPTGKGCPVGIWCALRMSRETT
jgi:hypothetical protein